MTFDNAPGVIHRPKVFCGDCEHFLRAVWEDSGVRVNERCAVATTKIVTSYYEEHEIERVPSDMNQYNNCTLFEQKGEK